ncbi:hypothetical protein ABPG74_018066 [Tetrahymena malaccensis]
MVDENQQKNYLNEHLSCIADQQLISFLQENDSHDDNYKFNQDEKIQQERLENIHKKDLDQVLSQNDIIVNKQHDDIEITQGTKYQHNAYENLPGVSQNLLLFDKNIWEHMLHVYQQCDRKLEKSDVQYVFYSKADRLQLIDSLKTQKMIDLREQVQQALNEKLRKGLNFDEKDNWHAYKNSSEFRKLTPQEKKTKEDEYYKKQAMYFKQMTEVLKKEAIAQRQKTLDEMSKWEAYKKKAISTKTQEEYFERIIDIDSYKRDILSLIENYLKMTKDQQNLFRISFQILLDKKPLQYIIQGDAGTGKSFLLKNLQNLMSSFFYLNVQVLASTGSAAMVLGGTTVHNFFNIGGNPKFMHKLQPNSEQYYRILNTDSYIFEEFSMLNSETILNANKKMKEVYIDKIQTDDRKETLRRMPLFCGKDAIFIGDALQLPPVLKKDEKLHDIVESEIFSLLPMYTLSTNIRQSSDCELQNILREVRTANKRLSIEVQNLLQQQVCESNGCNILDTDEDLLILCSKRFKRDEYNRQRFIKFNKGKTHYKLQPLIFEERGQDLEQILPSSQKYSLIITKFTEETHLNRFLNVAQGVPIVICSNIFDENNKLLYANGTRCIIDFYSEGQDILTLTQQTASQQREIFKLKRQQYQITENSKKYIIRAYPIEIAYAMTIHKAQGCTLDKVLIDFADFFAPGQAYTALSRCKTLRNIHIVNLNFTKFISSIQKMQFIQNKLEKNDLNERLKNCIHENDMLMMLFQRYKSISDAHSDLEENNLKEVKEINLEEIQEEDEENKNYKDEQLNNQMEEEFTSLDSPVNIKPIMTYQQQTKLTDYMYDPSNIDYWYHRNRQIQLLEHGGQENTKTPVLKKGQMTLTDFKKTQENFVIQNIQKIEDLNSLKYLAKNAQHLYEILRSSVVEESLLAQVKQETQSGQKQQQKQQQSQSQQLSRHQQLRNASKSIQNREKNGHSDRVEKRKVLLEENVQKKKQEYSKATWSNNDLRLYRILFKISLIHTLPSDVYMDNGGLCNPSNICFHNSVMQFLMVAIQAEKIKAIRHFDKLEVTIAVQQYLQFFLEDLRTRHKVIYAKVLSQYLLRCNQSGLNFMELTQNYQKQKRSFQQEEENDDNNEEEDSQEFQKMLKYISQQDASEYLLRLAENFFAFDKPTFYMIAKQKIECPNCHYQSDSIREEASIQASQFVTLNTITSSRLVEKIEEFQCQCEKRQTLEKVTTYSPFDETHHKYLMISVNRERYTAQNAYMDKYVFQVLKQLTLNGKLYKLSGFVNYQPVFEKQSYPGHWTYQALTNEQNNEFTFFNDSSISKKKEVLYHSSYYNSCSCKLLMYTHQELELKEEIEFDEQLLLNEQENCFEQPQQQQIQSQKQQKFEEEEKDIEILLEQFEKLCTSSKQQVLKDL